MFIPYSSFLELFCILFFKNFLENVLELSIICLKNCVLSREIKRNLSLKSIYEARMSKLRNRISCVVHSHTNSTISWVIIDLHHLLFSTILRGENNFEGTSFFNLKISGSVLITKSMSSNDDWFFPRRNESGNIFNDNRLSEHSSSNMVSNGTIRRFPHFFKLEFLNSCFIWSNGCTFNTNFALKNCFCSIEGNLVISSISVFHTKIKI